MKAFLVLLSVAYFSVSFCYAELHLKCFQCDHCDNETPVTKSCELKSEHRCLKFVGIDRAINTSKKIVKKRCSSDVGCEYFYNVHNYTVHTCEVCTAQLCNDAAGVMPSFVPVPLIIIMSALYFYD